MKRKPPRSFPNPRRWVAALLVFVFLCCSAGAVVLEVAFRPVFHGETLRLDSLRYENAACETLSFTRVSGLLSGFALEREDGVWFEMPKTHAWIDAAKSRTSLRLDGVPEGKYRALRFSLGPDAAANARDPAKLPADHPLNANLNGLHWNWQGG